MTKHTEVLIGINKKRNIKQIIVYYVTLISVTLGVILTILMFVTGLYSTASVLLDSLQITAKTSSQNVSSNLHLLADRMDALAREDVLTSQTTSDDAKKQLMDQWEERIEFVWIAAFDTAGNKLYGDDIAPASIADMEYYQHLSDTNNITIGEPYYDNDIWQLSVGIPVYDTEGNSDTYLVGSYKYDVLNDVLSNINIGNGGFAYIVDEEGNIIANKDISSMEKQENLYEMYSSRGNKKIFDAMLDFQSDAVSAFLGWEQCYIAYSPVAGTNWTLMIAAPRIDFMGILFWAMAISVVVIVILQVAARKLIVKVADKISNSLSLASDRLSLLSAGDLKEEVEFTDSNVEAEVLTTALSKTVNSLAGYIDDITEYLGQLSQGDYSGEVQDHFDGDFVAIKEALSSITESLNSTMYQINEASLAVNRNSSETSNYAKNYMMVR